MVFATHWCQIQLKVLMDCYTHCVNQSAMAKDDGVLALFLLVSVSKPRTTCPRIEAVWTIREWRIILWGWIWWWAWQLRRWGSLIWACWHVHATPGSFEGICFWTGAWAAQGLRQKWNESIKDQKCFVWQKSKRLWLWEAVPCHVLEMT